MEEALSPSVQGSSPILITTSVIFNARCFPCEGEASDDVSDAMDALARRIGAAIRQALAGETSVEAVGAFAFSYLGEGDDRRRENAYRCAMCGRWVTDLNRPEPLVGLDPGYSIGDAVYCVRDYEMQVGWSAPDEEGGQPYPVWVPDPANPLGGD